MRKSLKLLTSAGGLIVMVMSGPVLAGDVILFRGGAPAPDELAGIMFPQEEEQPKARTRGLRYSNVPSVPAVTEEPAREPAKEVAAAPGPAAKGDTVGFNITFALGSAELEPESRAYLDSIGRMLASERPDGRVAIAGHADARGDALNNMRLSQQRALAVREYLWSAYGIAPDRMAVIGYGETRPLPGTDPYDGVNRRVEFQPLS
jgi:outer membrane protein OmpA-like peptidoglycan-associated protein